MKSSLYKFALIICLGITLIGCSEKTNTTTDANAAAQNSAVSDIPVTWKKDVTPEDVAGLKWLVGTWRGTGEGQEPFYEQYKLDGTILTEESFADESLTDIKDSARYALVNGEFRFTTADGRRVAASEITADHIQFVPVVGGGNSYRFEKQSGGKWRAVLEWPATADQPAKKVIYNMESYKK